MNDVLDNRCLLVVAAFLLDFLIGDPERFFHPMRLIGRWITAAENWIRPRISNDHVGGVVLAVLVIGSTGLAVHGFLSLAGCIGPWAKAVVSVYFLYAALSCRSLATEVRKVLTSLKKREWTGARGNLSRIVGRDTRDMDEEQMLRATVETTAESTLDGIVSVLFYAFVGGPVLAMMFKAVSTLDSMVGYKNERYEAFGWASARLDDALNYLPARISSLLVVVSSLVLGLRPLRALKSVIRDAHHQPSPNSGYPEAAFAGALGIQLGGENSYQGRRVRKALLGDAVHPLSLGIAQKAVKLMFVTSFAALLSGVLISSVWPDDGLSAAQTQARLEAIVMVPYRRVPDGTISTQKRTSLRKIATRSQKTYRYEYLREDSASKTDGYADEKIFREWSRDASLRSAWRKRCEALKNLASQAHPSYAWALRFYRDAFESLANNRFGRFQHLYRKAQERLP